MEGCVEVLEESEPREEEEEVTPPSQLRRANATVSAKGVKRPWMDYDVERPDLARYFDEFADFGPEITDKERISMCRAYASYLASLQPKKQKSKK